jgi:hypothetical protein
LFASCEQTAKQTQRYLKKAVQILRHSLGIALAVCPFELDRGLQNARSISIFAVGSAVIAPLAAFLRYLLKQPIKVASTSEELLDLFDDRRALLKGDTALTSPNNQGRASEHFTLAASNDLAQQKRFWSLELGRGAASTSIEEIARSVLSPRPRKRQAQWGFRNFYSRRRKESSIQE